ncbi:snaclec alboaggregin-A subunit alpha-like isoform X2 [Sceloporus undulatus]|uniref:snaclec alboaggregin-A subunit alpha-like isoform X2 n=1 Tax=Sceloporus undulatus TaxID=8520 RepID=UPI001C4C4F0D|nr:snaclec alboaggregin-A subunit alpha-like isoform X2 [Sceloporus undulatus]XP_042326792.1 snaclec alboaggregin-A subunit alpha-like isoform X2 [Sceloporus undulatus]
MSSMAYLLLCLFSSLLAVTYTEDATKDSLVLPRSPCPPGVLLYNRFCYEFIKQETFWDNAERICGEWVEGAHLASILTPSEERMVTNYIKRYTKAKIVWIGLKAERADNELIWNWSDFSLYDSGSALWDDEKPKTCPSDKNEECIALSNVQNPAETPRWAQYPCRHSYQFICKYRASS